MKTAHIVYGINFGDEGKGLLTDFLSRKYHNSIVIRHNGGSQAGHTVVVDSKKTKLRHVCSHIGSGSLNGTSTYLGKEFICNPILFTQELLRLKETGFLLHNLPPIFVHPCCKITTPWDMIANQEEEKSLGDKKYGSCGVGIWHTINRSQIIDISVDELFVMSENKIREICFEISDYYGFTDQEDVIDLFLEDIKTFKSEILVRDYSILHHVDHLIFEGAQGLMLDKDMGTIPHVTPSNTGFVNPLNILEDAKIESEINTYGITRAYSTRHGAGPLPGEYRSTKYFDDTNLPHPYQDSIRFAPLDISKMKEVIMLNNALIGDNAKPHILITHLDQVKRIRTLEHGSFSKSECARIANILSMGSRLMTSDGPTSSHVKIY